MQCGDVFRVIKRYCLFIVAALLITGFIAGILSVCLIKNQYRATSTLIVNDPVFQNPSYILNYNNYMMDVGLINSYRDVCKSELILKMVIQQTGLPYTVSELALKIDITSNPNSQVFNITAQDSNPVRAAQIANSETNLFAAQIPSIMKVDDVQILNHASIPRQPSSPNRVAIVLLSLLCCLAFCAILIACIEHCRKHPCRK